MFLLSPINVAMFLSHMQMLLSPQLEDCLQYRAKCCQLRLFHCCQCSNQSDALMETFAELHERTSFWKPRQTDQLCCVRESYLEIPPGKKETTTFEESNEVKTGKKSNYWQWRHQFVPRLWNHEYINLTNHNDYYGYWNYRAGLFLTLRKARIYIQLSLKTDTSRSGTKCLS